MNTEILKKFMSRVKTATQAKTSDVRLPLNEANELAACVAELLVEVLEKRETKTAAPTYVEISVDGGALKK